MKAKPFLIILFFIFSTLTFASEHSEDLKADKCLNLFLEAYSLHLNKDPKILVVIDMQDGFPASKSLQLRRNIQNLIEQFKSENMPIFFLEYEDQGRTVEELLSRVQGYPLALRCVKDLDSGFYALKDLLTRLQITKVEKFGICGVNTDACVYDTVVDILHEDLAPLCIYERCCNAEKAHNHHSKIIHFHKLSQRSTRIQIDLLEGYPFERSEEASSEMSYFYF